jgi:hypothetical protein
MTRAIARPCLHGPVSQNVRARLRPNPTHGWYPGAGEPDQTRPHWWSYALHQPYALPKVIPLDILKSK